MAISGPNYSLSKNAALHEACLAAGISILDACGPSRAADIAARRRIVMGLLRARGWSTPMIGAALNRDHSTIVVGLKRLREGRADRRSYRQAEEPGLRPVGGFLAKVMERIEQQMACRARIEEGSAKGPATRD